MQDHKLKCWSQYFDAIKRGDKTVELRYNDRGYQKGDRLLLDRVHPLLGSMSDPVTNGVTTTESGERLVRTVSYIMHGGDFGLEPGWVAMCIAE